MISSVPCPGTARLPVIRGVEGTFGVIGVLGIEPRSPVKDPPGVAGVTSSSKLASLLIDKDPPPGPPRLFRAFFFCNAAAKTFVPVNNNKQ